MRKRVTVLDFKYKRLKIVGNKEVLHLILFGEMDLQERNSPSYTWLRNIFFSVNEVYRLYP